MDTDRPDLQLPSRFLARSVTRRDLVHQGGVAGLALGAAVVTGPSLRASAQEATPVVASPVASPVASGGARFAYVGTYTTEAPGGSGELASVGISVFAVDAAGGLTPVQTVASANPSFLALSVDQSVLYAINEIADFEGGDTGSIEAYAIDAASGQLTLINRVDSGGSIPAHLAVDPTGSFLVVANYVGSNYVVLPIRDDGGLDAVSGTVQQEGSGPNEERQEAPHPHAVVFDPSGGFVAGADLGIDQIAAFSLDAATGELVPASEVSAAPGAGPRHLAFHPDGAVLYAINELDATITAYAFDAATGAIGAEIQTVSTVPDGFVGTKSTAEIFVYPSGQFLYGSNRGMEDAPSAEANSIVAFSVDAATGELTLIGWTTEGIDFPRNFAIDPTGTWLYVCNQQGDDIVQFLIDPATGALSATGLVTTSPTPVCLVFKSA